MLNETTNYILIQLIVRVQQKIHVHTAGTLTEIKGTKLVTA